MDELLAKGAIEPSPGGASFYSNVFMVPKSIDGLSPILNHKQFNNYIHIPTFKMPISDRYSNLFSRLITLSLFFSRMPISICLLLSITIIMYNLFGKINLISGRYCH